jgi:hypothetical protein
MRTAPLLLRLSTVVLCCSALTVSAAVAQDSCSLDEVESALADLGCDADGTYISPQVAADMVSDRCADKPTEQACRACFRKASARIITSFKGLARAGFFDRHIVGEVKGALRDARDETCSFDEPEDPIEPPVTEPTPEPTPEPAPTAPPVEEPPTDSEPQPQPAFEFPTWPYYRR